MQNNKTISPKLSITTMLLLLVSVMSCSPYKSTWSCKIEKGLGCTSITYADELARKEIILNDSLHTSNIEDKLDSNENKVLITRHYADLQLKPEKEITLEQQG